MDAEQRDEFRRRARLRPTTCRVCGATNARVLDGAELSSDAHFPGTKYKVCGACGYEEAKGSRRLKRTLD